jgi:hypothetical protein
MHTSAEGEVEPAGRRTRTSLVELGASQAAEADTGDMVQILKAMCSLAARVSNP